MRTRRRFAALLGAAALTLLISGVAAAHNSSTSLTCEHGLKVNLTYYFLQGDNAVKIDLDGVNVVDEDDFGANFSYSSGALNPFVSHSAHVVVDAWDDADPESGPPFYSFDEWLEIPACEEPEISEAPETDAPSEPPASEPVESEPVASEPFESEPVASEPVESEPVSEPPPSFVQSQEGLTDAPSEPNTATLGGNRSSGPADGAWLLVVALGVLLASIVVLTPAPARRRK